MAQQPVPPPIRVPLVAGIERRSATEDKDELSVNVFYDVNKNVDKTMYGLHDVLNAYYATKRPGISVKQSGSGLGNGIFSYGTNLFIFQSYSPSTLGSGPADGGNWTFFAWASSLSLWVGTSSNNNIYTSPDLITWTLRSYTATLTSFSGLVWSGTKFLISAINSGFIPGPYLTSTDGINWTASTITASGGVQTTLGRPIWTGSEFIMEDKAGAVVTSPDGVTWTEHSSTRAAIGIASNGVSLVATDESSHSIISTDAGATWSVGGALSGGNAGGLTCYLGPAAVFITLSAANNSGYSQTSPDGTTWTNHAAALQGVANGIVANDIGACCIMASSGVQSAPYTTTDGITYTSLDPGVTDEWTAIALDGNNNFVIGGFQYIVRLTKNGPIVIPY